MGFKDMELSRDINVAFKQHMAHLAGEEGTAGLADKIDLTVNVLSMAFWPTYAVMQVHIPPYMSKYQTIFNKFYQGKYSGRKLRPSGPFQVWSEGAPSVAVPSPLSDAV